MDHHLNVLFSRYWQREIYCDLLNWTVQQSWDEAGMDVVYLSDCISDSAYFPIRSQLAQMCGRLLANAVKC
ncbi:hypothetical protein T02_5106 [Trichinella nativa]|uniref:Uncharacterized protein n=1 Tax=Trichinella nativa TaxID=6335 RepID=A0A0V1KXR4_9BILA|nr:hypothetical protein T02_5106 [Trichinella nativa]